MRWTFDPEFAATLHAAFSPHSADLSRLPGYRSIKENNARSVYRFGDPGAAFVVKRFKRAQGAARWKEHLLGTAAAGEWQRLQWLQERGVPVPRAAAMWEAPSGESGLVTVEIPGARPWKELLLEPDASRHAGAGIRAAANAVYQAHESGFLHADLHVGNLLVGADGVFRLIDVHRGSVATRLSLRDRLANLALLGYSLTTVLPRTAWRRLLREYLARFASGHRVADPRRSARFVAARIDRLRTDHHRRRTRRCLREGSAFHVEERAGWRLCIVRGIDPDAVLRVIGEHDSRPPADRPAPPPAGVVKETARIKLTRESLATPDGERAVLVKAFRVAGLRLRLKRALGSDPGKRAWVAAHGMRVRGLPTPEALAFVEPLSAAGARSSYLVVVARPTALPLDRYVETRFGSSAGRGRAGRDDFLRRLADQVRRLHLAGVHHHDLKANNVLVREPEGGCEFELVDLDRVSFASAMPAEARMVNLAQLNAATPGALTRSDRLRWLRWYAVGRAAFPDRRAAVTAIMQRTVARRHVWPPR